MKKNLANDIVDGSFISSDTGAQLAGNLSTGQLIFNVLSYNAPLGALATIVVAVIGYGIGIGAPLLFLGLGALMAIFAIGYTVMSKELPNPGAFYSYITAGLGRHFGLGASFLAITAYLLAMLSILLFASLATESLVRDTMHGPDIKWWVWALLFILCVGILGYRRVEVSAKVLGILLVLEIAIVAVWEAAVLIANGAAGTLTFNSFDYHSLMNGQIAAGIVFGFSSFSGFEATAIFRDEVREPQVTIPRATYLAIALMTVFYTIGSWMLIQALGEKEAIAAISANPINIFFDIVMKYLGSVGYHTVTALIITSSFAGLMANHNILSRYLFGLGADGILFRSLGEPHPVLKSPHRSSALLTAIAGLYVIGIAVSGGEPDKIFIQTIGIAGYAFIILFSLATVAISVYLFFARSLHISAWKRFVAPIISVIFMLTIAGISTWNIDLITNSPSVSDVALEIAWGTLLAGGFLAYVFKKNRPYVFARIGRQ